MTREQRISLADAAVTRAASLARQAEQAADSNDFRHKAQPLAAASAAWSDVARSHAAIAQALTDTPEV
ncbi:hypothetical protein ACFRDV_16505 [Streptomyces fagopyri]|uniref:hypothetical protein n=1 Tax=Streptomyces fagopyri TaxID=2662397 RepID=UPI0036ABD6F7